MLRFLPIVIFIFSFGGLVGAQDTCSADVALTFSRAANVCRDMRGNQACYGSGSIDATFRTVMNNAFSQEGDLVALENLHAIALDSSSGGEWTSVSFRVQANLSTSSQRAMRGILFGTASLTNRSASLPTILAIPRGTVNIRAAPQQGADIIARVGINGMLVADGRVGDNTWLRVQVPNHDESGWVSIEIVTLEQDINLLDVAMIDTPIHQPFDQLNLTTSSDPLCAGVPESGLLLQSPGLEVTVEVTINDVQVEFAGTVLVQAVTGQQLTVHILEGTGSIHWLTSNIWLIAGTKASIPDVSSTQFTIEPYSLPTLQTMPILYLDRRVTLPDPLSVTEIANLQSPATLTPALQMTANEPACQYTIIMDQNIRNGPGETFAVTGTAPKGTVVFPRGRITNAGGGEWLQIGAQAWINARVVEPADSCDPLPEIAGDFVSLAAINKVNLETCRPTNGPIQAGQRVTLEFVPHAWDTYAAAREATRYTYGRILVDERILYPHVSEPIKISDDEYVRRFSADWIAEVGTLRLEGNFYAYEAICIMTVTPN